MVFKISLIPVMNTMNIIYYCNYSTVLQVTMKEHQTKPKTQLLECFKNYPSISTT